MIQFDERVKTLGFKDEDELKRMILDVDLPDPVIRGMFEKWKREDLTKDGLNIILVFQRGKQSGRKLRGK